MSLKVHHSNKANVKEAITEIKEIFSTIEPKMVVYFSSSRFEPELVAVEFHKAFPNAETIGCTTAGEIVSGAMYKESIVAMALGEDKVTDLKVVIIENLSQGINLSETKSSISGHLGNFSDLTIDKFYGLILIDGLSGAEEILMDAIGTITDINIVGASAGDDLQFKLTQVMYNGKTYSNAAVLAVIKSGVKFDLIKTQSFKTTDKVLVPTKVIPENREVVEFNNKPAAIAYSEALGVSLESVPDFFMKHPVGLMIGDEPYVRSPQRVLDNNAMKFYCNVSEGMELSILESTDIIKDTREVIADKNCGEYKIAGIINFNCILRTLDLESSGKTEEYGKIFSDIPTVGFSTYGEEFIGHINQTATMLVLY